MKKPGTLFHVEFKSGANHYFGSIAAIFEEFTRQTLGVSRQRLYQVDIEEDKPYKNKICTIRKGTVRRKPGNRNRPSKNNLKI